MRARAREQSFKSGVGGRRAIRRRLLRDPRRIVALVGLTILGLGSGATVVLTAWVDQTEASVTVLADSIAQPKDHLLAAERANDAAQAALAAAVGATGGERSQRLSDAIRLSQETSAEWRDYQTAAIGLPGETELAKQYVDHQAVAQETSSAALVPILNSTTPGTLPQPELDTYQAVRQDLIALHTMYRNADRAALARLSRETDRSKQLLDIGVIAAFVIVLVGLVVGLRIAARSMVVRDERMNANHLAAFEARLRRALEQVDNDVDALVVAERAIHETMPDVDASLLRADSSRSRLTPLGAAPTCGVTSPDECPALRSGTTVSFADSDGLDACRTLARNTSHSCSATCVPITITGRGAAVMHLAGSVGHPPDNRGAADLIARGVGDRVTLLQALATFQLQAERDPLTGLLNRRSFEATVDVLVAGGRSYAVAFADLDHFKMINDLHGHEAGDRALRSFSRTLQESVRPNDLTCRWGGEEFLIVLPDCDAALAVEAMERVRTSLAIGSIGGQGVVVTASFGVADSTEGGGFEEIVARADAALRRAKEAGRNRVLRSATAEPDAEPAPTEAITQR